MPWEWVAAEESDFAATTSSLHVGRRTGVLIAPMANYFSGPSTAQMRLTMLLIGAAALVAGIYSATHTIEAGASDKDGPFQLDCGTAFDPAPATDFFPAYAQSCAAAVGPWPAVAIALYGAAAIFLIRFLYMMIGPKAPSSP